MKLFYDGLSQISAHFYTCGAHLLRGSKRESHAFSSLSSSSPIAAFNPSTRAALFSSHARPHKSHSDRAHKSSASGDRARSWIDSLWMRDRERGLLKYTARCTCSSSRTKVREVAASAPNSAIELRRYTSRERGKTHDRAADCFCARASP